MLSCGEAAAAFARAKAGGLEAAAALSPFDPEAARIRACTSSAGKSAGKTPARAARMRKAQCLSAVDAKVRRGLWRERALLTGCRSHLSDEGAKCRVALCLIVLHVLRVLRFVYAERLRLQVRLFERRSCSGRSGDSGALGSGFACCSVFGLVRRGCDVGAFALGRCGEWIAPREGVRVGRYQSRELLVFGFACVHVNATTQMCDVRTGLCRRR